MTILDLNKKISIVIKYVSNKRERREERRWLMSLFRAELMKLTFHLYNAQ